MTMQSLDAIGLRHGTDKASTHHDYLVFYDRFLRDRRENADLKLLEIGVYQGSSLRMWEEYFHRGRVVGIDIEPDTLRYASERATVELVDQSDVVQLVDLGVRHGPFDVVVDDGSHLWNHQITALNALFPFVKPGGLYIMEDLDTSYGTYVPAFRGIANESTAEYLHRICDYVVGDRVLAIAQEPDGFIRSFAPKIAAMTYHRRTCLIERKAG